MSAGNDEALKLAFEAHKKNERHRTREETRYWCDQYRLICDALISALERPVTLPTAATKEANDAIEAMLLTYNWPCNTQNAGRAGWEAARQYMAAQDIKGHL
jgi:hypothetical protein